ncbi:MAG: 3-hydroxyisobutyrate dehydrogenase [Legionella sp.]|nr:MAG: 3-hydroxyisobutyrate dehydrogenase [Legionella sp.]
MNIGFVGLGHMGLPMAINLVKAGHCVTGFDLQDTAKNAFIQAGGMIASNLSTLSNTQDIFITMLQSGSQVTSVCYGQDGLYAHARQHTLHIDCSTIDVPTTLDLHHHAQTSGLCMVDAPVSGGVAGAAAATLTFMLGGTPEACATSTPILEAMGKQIILTGNAGSGQAAKICNNMILGISMIAVAEGFMLAEKLGLAPKKLHEVVTHASGQCWVMDKYVPVPAVLENMPADRNYQPGFSLSMMLKDLHLSQEAAEHSGVTTPIAHLATQLFQTAKAEGLGDLDFSAIIKQIERC